MGKYRIEKVTTKGIPITELPRKYIIVACIKGSYIPPVMPTHLSRFSIAYEEIEAGI